LSIKPQPETVFPKPFQEEIMLEHPVDTGPDNDDEPVGHVLSRREIIKLLSVAGGWAGGSLAASGFAGSQIAKAQPGAGAPSSPISLPGCVARPAQTEGPFFVDEKLNRSDIRSDPSTKAISSGLPLRLKFVVSTVGKTCAALSGALVDVWHCDAVGRYSAENRNDTAGQQFLRGSQLTDSKGVAQFLTIYPGWYPGRAVHIHFKIRLISGSNVTHEFTSQLFFDDAFTDKVFKRAPYSSRGERTQRNTNDGIFGNGGNQLLLEVKQDGAGYAGTFDIGMNIA
jgi:protocatechuate 3,4-dioxygenase beta subunit